MSKKIELTFATLNADGQNFLTEYNKAESLVYNKTQSYRTRIAGLRLAQADAEKRMASASYDADRVRIQGELADILFKMSELDKAFKADPELKAAKETMKKLEGELPAGLYDAYVSAYETGADGALGQAISTLLISWGVDGAKNSSALRRFGSVLKIRIGGSRRASRKNRADEGVRLTAKSSRQFNGMVILALLDMFEVVPESEWTRADWENGTESEQTTEQTESETGTLSERQAKAKEKAFAPSPVKVKKEKTRKPQKGLAIEKTEKGLPNHA